MDDLIQKIIEIEAQAQQRVKNAEEKVSTIEENLGKKIEKLRLEIAGKAENKSAENHNTENEYTKKLLDEIATRTQADIEKLDRKFKENKDSWTDDIVKKILVR